MLFLGKKDFIIEDTVYSTSGGHHLFSIKRKNKVLFRISEIISFPIYNRHVLIVQFQFPSFHLSRLSNVHSRRTSPLLFMDQRDGKGLYP